jgi:putative flippase GtrA
MVTNNALFRKVLNNNKKFLRFQLTAIIATVVDFLFTIILKEIYHLNYSIAVAIGATLGAITAFSINRYWVFRSMETHPVEQGLRYLLVAAGSIVLNTAGTYLLTELTYFPYIVSKAIIALVIGFTYSYYFSKRFVFYA